MALRGKLEYWELSINFKKKSPRSPQFTGSNWKGLSQGREHSKYYFTFYLHRKSAWRGGESSLHAHPGQAPPSTEREKHRCQIFSRQESITFQTCYAQTCHFLVQGKSTKLLSYMVVQNRPTPFQTFLLLLFTFVSEKNQVAKIGGERAI